MAWITVKLLREAAMLKIKYIHHSGFIIESAECAIIIDCCGLTMDSPEIRECADKKLYVLASHAHSDHFDPNIMFFRHPDITWVLSADIVTPEGSCCGARLAFFSKGGMFSSGDVRIKAYGSTDEGISFFIETAGKKIFHAGDLNNWHWNEEETLEEAAKNEKRFLDELKFIAKEVRWLDAAMFPLDPRLGNDYTRGAEQFLDSIKTGLFVPMHFGDNIEAARAFKSTAEQKGCRFADIRACGDVFEL